MVHDIAADAAPDCAAIDQHAARKYRARSTRPSIVAADVRADASVTTRDIPDVDQQRRGEVDPVAAMATIASTGSGSSTGPASDRAVVDQVAGAGTNATTTSVAVANCGQRTEINSVGRHAAERYTGR